LQVAGLVASALVAALLAGPAPASASTASASETPAAQDLDSPPQGLVLVFPGFGRRCDNLAGLMRAFAQSNWISVCEPGMDVRYVDRLHRQVMAASDRYATPTRWVLAGHSAGGAQALALAAQMGELAPGRLAGVMMFDPVARDPAALARDLIAVARGGTPVLVDVAPPSRCNVHGASASAVRTAAADVPGVQVTGPAPGATHLDAEGTDAEAFAVAACGEGLPQATAVQRLLSGARAFLTRVQR
jgi:pimeloyl-ACP methyl ester carboxylesterase